MKTCSKCQQTLPYAEFHKSAKHLGGVHSICKNCKYSQKSIINSLISNTRSRAKQKGLEHNLTAEFITDLNVKQSGKCAITGDLLNWEEESQIKQRYCPPNRVSIDRIDSSKGYTQNNVQLVTELANRVKTDLSIQEFYEFCKKVVNK